MNGVTVNPDGTVTYTTFSGKTQTVPYAQAVSMGLIKDDAGNTVKPAPPPPPPGTTPGPTPGSYIDSTGAIHYPAADTTGYGQIGAAFDQRPQDILAAMDASTKQQQDLIAQTALQGQNNLNNAATASREAGQQILATGYNTAANQGLQGQTGLQQAASLADYNNALGSQAMSGFQNLGLQAQQASANYGAQGDQLLAQQQSLQGTGIQQLMGMQQQNQQSLADYANFANRGAGPSAAEAQLAFARDQAQADAISLANSGRGVGQASGNMRQAMSINAATQQQTAMQMAQLRAQEEQAWRQQQLQAIAGAGQLGLSGGQAAQSAWQNYIQQAGQAASGASQLGATYAGMSKDLYGAGVNAQQGYSGQANSALNTGFGYNQGMTSNANQATATGLSGYDSLATQGNQLTSKATDLGMQAAQQNASFGQANTVNKNNLYTTQLQSDTSRYGANMGVAINSANNSAQQQAALVGAAGTVIGGVLGGIAGGPAGAAAGGAAGGAAGRGIGSDIRMKEKIKPEPELASRMQVINKFMLRSK